ncbi:MAG: oligosaccharide flippase family protein, partial [Candidatus Nanoarchaeia archaeon]|nr:oligosaccharide flippase family protein [Candidatus Nanoarchaeia archaeon]
MKELSRLGKNATWQIFGKGLGTALSMIIVFYIIRLLGPRDYGTFTLLTTILNIFLMIGGLGTESSMAYFLSKYKQSARDLIKKFLKIRVFLAIIGAIILLMSMNFISDYYNNPELKTYLPLIAFSMPFFILMNVSPQIFQGLNNLKEASISELIFYSSKIIAIPLIIWLGLSGGIIGYAIAYFCYCLYAYKKIFHLSKEKTGTFTKIKEFTKFSFINYFGTITLFLSANLMQLLLGKNPAELGYLDASMRIGMILSLVPNALLTALVPILVGKTKKEIKKVSSKILNYILISSLPFLAFFFFAPDFTTIALLGPDFFGISKIIQIASIMFFFNIISGFFESISYSIGKNKYIVLGNIIRFATIALLGAYAISALNAILILLAASLIVLLFISIITRGHYRIDFKSAMKT